MTFHLEGPWLSTTGKKKGPKKWASSEAKAKAALLDQEWKAKMKKWGVDVEDKKRSRALSAPTMAINSGPKVPPGRETPYIASRDTGFVPCTKAPDKVYTGTAVLGISTLHKSNGVPVFSKEEATDISKMRR
jgi:hypothetical protein